MPEDRPEARPETELDSQSAPPPDTGPAPEPESESESEAAIDDRSARRRSSFGPVVLLGLAAGGLAAVAGHKPWAEVAGSGASTVDTFGTVDVTAQLGEMPAAGALALVVLACWGVLLVTRGRVRRLVGAVALLAALGLAATVVTGFADVPNAVRDALPDLGLEGSGVRRTSWFWLTAVGALGCLAATALAVRLTPGWPEMGSRYDAPGGEGAQAQVAAPPAEERSNLELWKELDEGHDPTS